MTDVARQLRHRLASLKAAGVEFLPAGAGPGPSVEAVPAADSSRPAVSLFTPSDAAPGDPTARRRSLSLLADEVAGCSRCPELFATRSKTVFGVGRIDAEICFVGEAPGAEEDRQGEPFVGPAGQLLNRIISACGFERSDVYICNTIKCRPPNNREPAPEEKSNCRGFFERQLDLVAPRFICCLGAVAAKSVLNTTIGITKLRGRFHDFRGIPVLCTFHPAYLLRNPDAKKDCWDDMKLLLKRMGRPIPGAK
jgi:DNA polymerase